MMFYIVLQYSTYITGGKKTTELHKTYFNLNAHDKTKIFIFISVYNPIASFIFLEGHMT